MININCTDVIRPLHNYWNNIHFHPTDAIEDEWGQAILNEVARDGVAKTVRMYAMLEDIVSLDADGNLQYNFTENDVRMDYMVSKGFNLLICYNFLPPCITEDTNHFQHANKKSTRYKGKRISTSRLKDEAVWEEICYRYTEHIVKRYGLENVEKWYLQCYNEPDIPVFFMTELGERPETLDERVKEYMRLYRGLAHAAERVSPTLKVGGPATAGRIPFCEKVLSSIKREGLKFDFFSGHSYGTDPQRLNDGTLPYDTKSVLDKIKEYQDLLDVHFPNVEILIDEWGASCCGFYDREECSKLLFREGSEFAAYYGKMIAEGVAEELRISKQMICLSGQHDLPCDFSGCRNFMGINLIKKPIYNAYVLGGKLLDRLIYAKTDNENITVLATGDDGGSYSVMLSYSSEHFDKRLPDVNDKLTAEGISGEHHVRIWCIDRENTNPYEHAKKMAWGDHFDDAQIKKLREIGNIKPLAEYDECFDGVASIPLSFTSDALVFVEIIPIK